MKSETRKLLRAMAKAEGITVDEMLERVIQEAAGWRGLFAQQEPASQYKRERFPFQHRNVHALSPDSIERVWKTRIRSANHRAKREGISGKLTYEGWMAVLKRFGDKCAHCGTQEYLFVSTTLFHLLTTASMSIAAPSHFVGIAMPPREIPRGVLQRHLEPC